MIYWHFTKCAYKSRPNIYMKIIQMKLLGYIRYSRRVKTYKYNVTLGTVKVSLEHIAVAVKPQPFGFEETK